MTMTICPHCGGSLREDKCEVALWLVCECGNRMLMLDNLIISDEEMHAQFISCYHCGGRLKYSLREHINGIGVKYTDYLGKCDCGAKFAVTSNTIKELTE